MIKKTNLYFKNIIRLSQVLVILFLSMNLAKASIPKDSLYKDYFVNQVQLVPWVGSSFFSQPTAFFDEYQRGIGGLAKQFHNYLQFGFALKYQFAENYRLAINTSYNFARMQDNFSQYYETATISAYRYISERFEITTVPIIPTLEYLPNNNQFRSIIAFGAGVIYSYIYWYEGVSSQIPNDLRKSGIRYEEKTFYPAISFSSAVELRFDKEELESFIESVIIEGKISYFARKIKIFENFKSQFISPSSNWDKSYPIVDNIITLSIGLSMNTTKFFLQRHN